MQKIVIVAAAALMLASVAAYAQMQPDARQDRPMHQDEMHQRGSGSMRHGMMHGDMMRMMHAGMMQGGMHGGTSHGESKQPKGDSSPSSLAFHAINKKMHDGMDIAFTGNADGDFVKGMIPHHQGAIDMAKTALAFGKDPEVRKLAEEIAKAQENEIGLMRAWLKKNGQ